MLSKIGLLNASIITLLSGGTLLLISLVLSLPTWAYYTASICGWLFLFVGVVGVSLELASLSTDRYDKE